MAKRQPRQGIPTNLSVAQFEQFVLPHLSKGRRGPATKLGWHTIWFCCSKAVRYDVRNDMND
jgi:hypothetical protein